MQQITPYNDMTIDQDTTLEAGNYILPKGITITGDSIRVIAEGVHIMGANRENVGVRISGKNITLRGLSCASYYHGIYANHCENLTLDSIRARDTYEIDNIETFLHLWQPLDEAYGGAVVCHDVQHGMIINCDVQHQLNGIQLYDCHHLTVEKNNGSFNSGWGVYLNACNHNVIKDNQLDFCNRLFRRPENGSVRAEADAAGIVMVHGSSRNSLLRNSCIGGGDGIFITGYQHPNVIRSCSDNLIEDNDCRLSPNNAIESTFCQGNIFRRNDVSRSNYGLWMGYSWENTLEENHVEFNRWAGIAIEHGHDWTIQNNVIQNNHGDGMRLWLRGKRGDVLLQYWEGYEATYNFTMESNTFKGNHVGFNAYTPDHLADQTCYGFHLIGNTFEDNRIGASFERVDDCSVTDNQFINNIEAGLRLLNDPDVTLSDNHFANNHRDIMR